MKRNKKLIGIILIVVGLGFMVLMSNTIRKEVIMPPQPYQIDLSEFSGRILSGNNVHPGTFTISRPFEEIEKWNEKAVLTFEPFIPYSKGRDEVVKIQIWEPDSVTSGVFLYAEKEFPLPWISEHRPFYGVGEIINKDKVLYVMPRLQEWLIIFVASIAVFLGGVCCVFGIIQLRGYS
jgi:hypothetical protein